MVTAIAAKRRRRSAAHGRPVAARGGSAGNVGDGEAGGDRDRGQPFELLLLAERVFHRDLPASADGLHAGRGFATAGRGETAGRGARKGDERRGSMGIPKCVRDGHLLLKCCVEIPLLVDRYFLAPVSL